MFFIYLTRCFWLSVAITAMTLLNNELIAIVFGLITVSFAILLNGAMREK